MASFFWHVSDSEVSSECLGCPGSGAQHHLIYRTEYNTGYGIYAEAHVDLSKFETRIRMFLLRFSLQSTFDRQWASKVIGNYEFQHRQTRCAHRTQC